LFGNVANTLVRRTLYTFEEWDAVAVSLSEASSATGLSTVTGNTGIMSAAIVPLTTILITALVEVTSTKAKPFVTAVTRFDAVSTT
jgi:hypothetical protein